MGSVPPLLTFLLIVVSGWVHCRQLIVIEFLQAEIRLLKQRLRGKRVRFSYKLSDFIPLARYVNSPMLIMVSKNSPFEKFDDLVS